MRGLFEGGSYLRKYRFKLAWSTQQASSMHLRLETTLLSAPLPFWNHILMLHKYKWWRRILFLKIIWLYSAAAFSYLVVLHYYSEIGKLIILATKVLYTFYRNKREFQLWFLFSKIQVEFLDKQLPTLLVFNCVSLPSKYICTSFAIESFLILPKENILNCKVSFHLLLNSTNSRLTKKN